MDEEEFDVSKVEPTNEMSELEQIVARWKANEAKKNFPNWFNGLFSPSGFGGWSPYYLLLHPWDFFKEVGRQIEWAWQRVFRGWDDRAVWSADTYFAEQIVEIVSELRKIGCGVPMSMFYELPYEDESNYRYSDESEKIAIERWNKILDDIVFGFNTYLENYNKGLFNDNNTNNGYAKAFDLFEKHFGSLWW